MTIPKQELADFLIEDDASKYLAQLSDEERCQRYGNNGRPKTIGSFTPEEHEAVIDILCPKPMHSVGSK